MSPKRPSSPPKPSTASGSTSPSRTPDPPSKRAKRSSDILSGHSIHILHPKLDSSRLAHLHALASSSGASLAPTPAQADVIVTAIGMRKRLERHIDWTAAQSKAVVRPAWLEDSVARGRALPCADYAALRDLKTSTAASCPDPDPTYASEADAPESHSTKLHSYLSPPADPPPFAPADFDPFERYSCRRPCPLVCPTQDLVEDLDVIRRSRVLEGEERSALSYARAIGVIKSYPKRISRETFAEVQKLPNLGAKLLKMVGEWLDTGEIAEIETIKASDRFTSLSAFASIYGIGPTTARRLYNLGVRTLTELEVYYEVEPGSPPPSVDPAQSRGHEKRTADDEEDEKDAWIKIALALRHDFAKKISRAEAERIRALVGAELEGLQPGCECTIVGGYRRGKDECGDVDLVFTHPDGGKVPGLAKRLVKVLYEKGLVTHVIHSSGFRAHNPLRTSQFDALEKALTVFRLPGHDQPARRVDLVFTLPETYWTAIVGWTGSMMFERDLRSVAKEKGMKFDSSGISRRRDSKLFFPRSEKEVFDLFDLRWIPPEWRNADV